MATVANTMTQRIIRWKDLPAARNFAWLGLDRGIRMVVSVFVGFWVARYFGPERFGLFNYALAAVALAGPIAELGLEAVARREFVRDPEAAATLAGTVLRLRLGGGVVALVVIFAVAVFSGMSGQEKWLFVILSFGVLQPAAMISESWLQSRLESRKSVVPQWIALCIGALLRVSAILNRAPIEVFALIVVVEQGLTIFFVVRTASASGLRFGRFDPPLARRLLSECWPLALASSAVMIYMRIDILMLRWMNGEAASGQYAAAVRLSEMAYFVPTILAASVQPGLARTSAERATIYKEHLQRYFDMSALIAYAFAVPAALLAPWIIRLAYGNAYATAAPILAIHAWASLFVFLGVARSQYLINAGLTRFSLAATVTGAVLNIGLNIVLIPRWSGLGAAIATVISYAVSAWLSSFCSSGVRPIGWMQARALISPIFAWRYLCKT